MPQASDIVVDKNVSFLFKGGVGFGKTLAAASYALLGPTFIAYFDKKKPVELVTYFTQKRFGDRAKKILDNIEYEIYGSTNVHEYLNKMIRLGSDCRYVNVITDSVTNLTAAAVNWSLAFRSPGGKDKVHKDASKIIPDFDEYKIETSIVSQSLDIGKTLPCNVIWIAHPLPSIKVEGSGASMRVTKVNPIVTYGSKVAGMIPGNFTEIYHFSQLANWDQATGKSSKRYVVNTEAVGDEYAKSPLLGDYIKEFDITDKLFYETWKELLDKSRGIEPKTSEQQSTINNPFNIPSSQQTGWKV